MPAIDILLQAIHSPGDSDKLALVRRNATSILDALERYEAPPEDRGVSHSVEGREWMARVYSSLAGDEGEAPENSAIVIAMEELRQSEEQEVGEAFAQVCTSSRRLAQWQDYFMGLPHVDDDVQLLLRQDKSVVASESYGDELVGIGLTPMMFFGATRSMQLIFDQAHRAVRGRADDTSLRQWSKLGAPAVRLHFGDAKIDVPEAVLCSQVAGVQNLPAATARPMVHWTLDALADRPYFVAGYEYDVAERSFAPSSRKWGHEPQSLMARWSARH